MYARLVENQISTALQHTRVVLIHGPRQSGKTTLARQLVRNSMRYFNLEDPTDWQAASTDPVGFVRTLDRAVIDEIQRSPELLLAIKSSVDSDQRAGRFIFTGSANLMTVPRVSDSFAGRMRMVQLLPLAQCEVFDRKSNFLDLAFSGQTMLDSDKCLLGEDLVELVLRGGYPEPIRLESVPEREIWHQDYVEALIQKDIREIGQIRQLPKLRPLMRVLAEFSSNLVNFSQIGNQIGLNHVTTREYIALFERMYLVSLLAPWYASPRKRLVKTPKLHFIDSGLLATLKDLSIERIRRDRSRFGSVLETFVYSELLKLSNASRTPYGFFHARDKDKVEVDFVVEDRSGRVVALEVKAGSTVTSGDFRGIRKLQDDLGDRFVAGFVLYDDERPVPFGEKLAAIPLSTIWS